MLGQAKKISCLSPLRIVQLVICLTVWSTGAQENSGLYKVQILTTPSPTQVYLDVSGKRQYEKFLGDSDEALLLDLRHLEKTSGFNIILRREGYFDKTERIAIGYFQTRDRYPETGRIRLEPENWTVPLGEFLHRHRALLTTLLSFLFLLGWLGVRQGHARRVRMRTLERISTEVDDVDPFLNTVLQGWRLVSLLGKGGSASVYRAIPDDTLDQEKAVAIKLFTGEAAKTEDFKERFQREARLYQSLHHPGIVELHDWGRQGDLSYMVMELAEGAALKAPVVKNVEQEKRVLDILLQTASALAHAHNAGVIHRDVKPENIVLTKKGRVKLLDFGLAREVLSSFTKTGQALGTPLYMAPEQIQGSFVDHRCDQYGLGATAYELFSGQKTFCTEENTATPLLFQQVNKDPLPLRERGAVVSEQTERLVEKLMNRDPNGRFANMLELVEALQELREQL